MEKDKIKRFIDCYVPVTTCNLRCHYCYITQQRKFDAKLPEFKYSAEYIAKALSKERLGGVSNVVRDMNFGILFAVII